MKLNRFLPVLGVLLFCTATVRADLASIFTNANNKVMAEVPRGTSIIFIQCHDLAPGDLSCYGQTNFQTPTFDRLAREGIRFTHYTGAAESAGTTAALLNGKNSVPLPGEANLAQRLRQAGYQTGLIGEWSQPGQPWKLGFDEFAGFMTDSEGQNYYADYIWRYAPHSIFKGQGRSLAAFEGREMIYPNTGGQKGKYIPDVFFDAAANFAKVNQPDYFNHHRPFFLLLNLSAPRTAKIGADEFPVPSDAPFTSEAWPQAAKNRAALISRVDTDLGRLLEQLKKLNMTNNVAIFVSSSSAPEKFADANLDFLLPKQDFRSTNAPVQPVLPMIVWWPGVVSPGQVSDKEWSAADFASTAMQIATQKAATDFKSQSILSTLIERPGTRQEDRKP